MHKAENALFFLECSARSCKDDGSGTPGNYMEGKTEAAMAKAEMVEIELSLDQILLDPNNYRFHDLNDFIFAEPSRFHEENVQNKAFARLKDEPLQQLKASFQTNGFIPIEKIVVRRYEFQPDKYVVIEGNRRIAAIKWLKSDYEAGLKFDGEFVGLWDKVPCVLIEKSENGIFESLMGIRHISGIKQWGGYQRAKLVHDLKENFQLETSEIAARLGMSRFEVNRRYRAFKALKQMEDSEDFGQFYRSDLYPLFHEAVSQPIVRDWLEWDNTTAQFTNEENLNLLYQLISPDEQDDQQREAKITTYNQIRDLKNILPNTEARKVLFDREEQFSKALAIAAQKDIQRHWITQVSESISALKSISAVDLETVDEDNISQIRTLKTMCEKIIGMIEYSKSQQDQ